MALSTKTRFEVLKRDRYTCSYCGKHPPDVLLEVDHITPLAAGGSDDLANLTTACWDCNRGKSDRLLEEGTGPSINRAAVTEMAERVEQAKQYMELLGTMQAITEQQVLRVQDRWATVYHADTIEKEDGSYWQFEQGQFPNVRSIRQFILKLGLGPVLDAIDITAARFAGPSDDACRYFYGVCHHSIREGREPLAQPPEQTDSGEAHYEGYLDGKERGAELERARIGAILLNYQEHGFAYLADAVAALWPTDG